MLHELASTSDSPAPSAADPTLPGWRDRIDGFLAQRTGRIAVYVVVFGLAALAPAVLGDFWVGVLPRFLVLGILALSLDLLWGYGGLLSFGQGAFFGLGAYAMALSIKHLGPGGVWLTYAGWALAILVAVLVAVLLGYFMFYGGVSGVFFGIITLSVTTVLGLLAVSSYSLTGGENGVTGVTSMAVGIPGLWTTDIGIANILGNYYTALAGVFVMLLLTRYIVRGPAGRALLAVQANEGRTEALGYNVALIKLIVFATSAGIAGFAGALYTPLRLVNPELFSVTLSVTAIIFVAVGGRRTLIGALIGAVTVNVLQQLLAANSPQMWLLILGVTFVVVVLFFPVGIAGAVANAWRRGREAVPPVAHLEDLVIATEPGGDLEPAADEQDESEVRS
jgi:urea transport system permease protein